MPAARGLTPSAKGVIASLAAGSIWTRALQRDRGYDVEDVSCALCGAVTDTLEHRIFECAAVWHIRQGHDCGRLLRWLRAAGGGMHLALRGLLPHPADGEPRPGEKLQAKMDVFDASAFAAGFGGDIFVDGSCTRHSSPEFERAGWSAVMVAADGSMIAALTGVVPSYLPQTPQAAEYLAVAESVRYLTREAVYYEDCKNVYVASRRLLAGGGDRRRRCGMYDAQLSRARRGPGFELMRDIIKVKAHREVHAGMGCHDTFTATGNDHADAAAKKAVRRARAKSSAKASVSKPRRTAHSAHPHVYTYNRTTDSRTSD